MPGLLDTLRNSPAVISELAAPRVKRVRHGNTTIAVDPVDEVSLILNLSEKHRATRHAEGRSATGQPRVGAVTLIPPGSRTILRLDGMATVLMLRLSWAELRRWSLEELDLDAAGLEVQPRLAVGDPVLARWVFGAACGVEGQDEALRAVAARLLCEHGSSGRQLRAHPAGGLAPFRLRRVQELVEAELHRPLALDELAASVGMSTFHFAREFRRSTGVPPHRYVLQRRLAHAVMLMQSPALPVTEIAAACGFAHPSHLARHMRRTTGTATDAFRSAVLLR